jgi:hypothetical protein
MKKYFWLCALVVVAIVAAFMSAAMTPAEPTQAVGTPVLFTELARGDHSDVSRRANFLITSSSELSQLWKMIDSQSEKPTIDFTKNTVVALFMGTKPTGGYSIEVTRVSDGEKRTVSALLKTPGGSCIVDQVVTNPYQIVSVPITTLAFGHTDEASTISCLQ